MKKNRVYGRLALAMLLMIAACGKKDEDTGAAAGPQPVRFPEGGTMDLMVAPAGTYKASAVRSTMKTPVFNLSGTIEHKFRTAGKPAEGDPLKGRGDWTNMPKGSSMQLLTEIHLPLRLVATGTDVSFEDARNYWHYTRNDGWTQWAVSGSGEKRSVASYPFYLDFLPARKKGNVYSSGPESRSTAVQDGKNLKVYFETIKDRGADGKEVRVVEITYVKE